MALLIPTFSNPYSSAPLTSAYAWLAFLALDLSQGTGRVVFNVHPTAEDWSRPPVAQVSATLGQDAGTGVTFPTLAELMADPEFAAAYRVVGAKIYQQAAAKVPAFAGSSQV